MIIVRPPVTHENAQIPLSNSFDYNKYTKAFSFTKDIVQWVHLTILGPSGYLFQQLTPLIFWFSTTLFRRKYMYLYEIVSYLKVVVLFY